MSKLRWQLLGAIVSALNVAVPLILDIRGIVPDWPWQCHALIGFSVFTLLMFWIAYEPRQTLARILNTTPRFILKGIDEHFPGNVTSFHNGVFVRIEKPDFTRIYIANEPARVELGVEASKVYGEIEFRDETRKDILFRMSGRWAETKEIIQGAEPMEIEQIDIPPNGRPFCIDIGLKYHDEEEFYGYNNETPRKETQGFRDPSRKLGVGVYFVGVRLRCKGTDTTFGFKLQNLGKGKDVLFKSEQMSDFDKLNSQNV